MTAKRDYYQVLELERDADIKAIENAFQRLTTRYFPDHGKTPDIDGRFKEIAEAFAVLHDLQKRAEYDAGGHVAVAGYSCRDLFAGMDFDRIFQGLARPVPGSILPCSCDFLAMDFAPSGCAVPMSVFRLMFR